MPAGLMRLNHTGPDHAGFPAGRQLVNSVLFPISLQAQFQARTKKLPRPEGAGAVSATRCVDQAVLTSILRGCTCAAFGIRSFSTPFLNAADVFSVSSSRDRLNTLR